MAFVYPTLACEGQWLKFAESALVAEMVLSRKGRKMFPGLSLTIDNIPDSAIYTPYLEFITDNEILTFNQEQKFWQPASENIHSQFTSSSSSTAQPRKMPNQLPPKSYVCRHPKGPISGFSMIKDGLNFDCIKLTNRQEDVEGKVGMSKNVVLSSMRRYTLRVHFVRTATTDIFNPCQTSPFLNFEAQRLAVIGALPPFSNYEQMIYRKNEKNYENWRFFCIFEYFFYFFAFYRFIQPGPCFIPVHHRHQLPKPSCH